MAAIEETTSDMMGLLSISMDNKGFSHIPANPRSGCVSESLPGHESDRNNELLTINSMPATAAKESWKLGVKMDRGYKRRITIAENARLFNESHRRSVINAIARVTPTMPARIAGGLRPTSKQ